MKNSEIDSVFFSDGYNLAKKHLEKELSVTTMLQMSDEVYHSIDELMKSFITRCALEGKKVDCEKGCFHCCCQTVLALPYEVLFLYHFITENNSDNEIRSIRDNSSHKNGITSRMTLMDFLHYKSPCPLLKDGACCAYEARPMACRTYISSDREGCIREYNNPADMDNFPDLYAFTIRTGRMINEGICAFLTEKSIPVAEWQLESLLLTAFDERNPFQRWINGENVFRKRNYSDEEIMYLYQFGSGNRKSGI